jgi:hypothetical protein
MNLSAQFEGLTRSPRRLAKLVVARRHRLVESELCSARIKCFRKTLDIFNIFGVDWDSFDARNAKLQSTKVVDLKHLYLTSRI